MVRSSIQWSILAALFGLVAAPGPTARADLLKNGGFETPVVGAGNLRELPTLSPQLNPWVIVAGTVDVVDKGFWPSFEGDQSLDNNGSSAGTIVQQFQPTSGQMYTLTFRYANDPNGPAGYTATSEVSVFSDPANPVLSQPITHRGSTNANMMYVLFSANFRADAASMSLRFKSTIEGANGIVLHDVHIEPAMVPEPGSFALLGLGACGLLGLGRCRAAFGRRAAGVERVMRAGS